MRSYKFSRYHCSFCRRSSIAVALHTGSPPDRFPCSFCQSGDCVLKGEGSYGRPRIGLIRQYPESTDLYPRLLGQPLLTPLFQIQPNRASCLPTAFAILLGKPVWEILLELEHDGTETLFANQPPPGCYRSFHIQELIYLCYIRGYAVTPYEPISVSISGDSIHKHQTSPLFEHVMKHNRAILVGKSRGYHHAVAWLPDYANQIVNPSTGSIGPIKDLEIRTLYTITPIKSELVH